MSRQRVAEMRIDMLNTRSAAARPVGAAPSTRRSRRMNTSARERSTCGTSWGATVVFTPATLSPAVSSRGSWYPPGVYSRP